MILREEALFITDWKQKAQIAMGLPWPLAMPLSDPFLMCAKEWVWEGMEEAHGASSFKNSSLPNQTCFPLV